MNIKEETMSRQPPQEVEIWTKKAEKDGSYVAYTPPQYITTKVSGKAREYAAQFLIVRVAEEALRPSPRSPKGESL